MVHKKKLLINPLDKKITIARNIIKKIPQLYPIEKTVVAWTGGKDSTVLLHLIRTTFNKTVPFPVMFNDSTMEFEEVYTFIKNISRLWNLNMVIVKHDEKELKKFHSTMRAESRLRLSRVMKIHSLKKFQQQHRIAAYIAGIRRDEHTARSHEKFFSKRSNHVRIHPILHFTENDVWKYIHTYNVPYVPLYDQGYRSLGEKPFTSKAIPGKGERSGRDQEKEKLMDTLRNMGYW